MEIDFETLKIVLPIVAIVISLATIFINKKNIKKQIRVSKIEEILEIINSLSQYYVPLLIFVNDKKSIEEKNNKKEKLVGYQLEHDEKVKRFLKTIDKEALQKRMNRLYVLANAYLSSTSNNNLKARILTLSQLYGLLFQTIVNNDLFFIDQHYKSGLPRRAKFGKFIMQIENDLIREMKLGHTSLSNEDFNSYRNKNFKKELGIEDER